MTDMTGKAAGAAGDGGSTAPEPTQAEIDAWAATRAQAPRGVAERPDRRGARGIRRSISGSAGWRRPSTRARRASTDTRPDGRALGREGQLAAEGAVALLYRYSRRTFAELVRAGREWEEETSLPTRRRRVSHG